MKRSYPIPEAIYRPRRGRWDIADDWQARVDIRAGQFFAPLGNDPHCAVLRAHELAHVAFSPVTVKVPTGTTMQTLQGVENARVNTLAKYAGVDVSAGAPPQLFAALTEMAVVMSEHPRSAVSLLLSCFTEAERAQVIKRLAEHDSTKAAFCDRLSRDATRMLTHGTTYGSHRSIRFDRTIKVSRWLETQYEDNGETRPGDGKRTDGPLGAEVRAGLASAWGDLIVEYPDLKTPKRTRGVRVSDEGCVLRAPWRVTSDHKVFRACLRAPRRGTILIDASGSMGLTAEDVQALAAKVPAGIVAAYGGRDEDGTLRVLAKHGKLAGDGEYQFDGGNVVDGPCLAWLGRQYGPRIWISDGRVTGKFDRSNGTLTAEAQNLQERFQIKRARHVADAIRLLK